jgi:hypothetical protein
MSGAPTTSGELASAVIEAARKARSTGSDPPPEPDALAKRIIAAGKERRNPKPWVSK